MEKYDLYLQIEKKFALAGFHLYLTGGTVRDYLLARPSCDLDMASDARPEEVKKLFPEADTSFARFGTVRWKMDGETIEVTTLRKESEYLDFRHPHQVQFVQSPSEDCRRRDFTINGLYLDASGKVYDEVGGLLDLSLHRIKTIGDADVRLSEDPLRILRAIRFAITLDFQIEETLQHAIVRQKGKLQFLRKEKVQEEIRKIKKIDEKKWEKWKALYGLEEL